MISGGLDFFGVGNGVSDGKVRIVGNILCDFDMRIFEVNKLLTVMILPYNLNHSNTNTIFIIIT
jgi:hypothetical protein